MAKEKTAGLTKRIVVALFLLIGMAICSGQMAVTEALELDEKGNIVGAEPLTYPSAIELLGLSILIFNPYADTPARITGLGYSVQTTTSLADLTLSNLSNYNVLWISIQTDPTIYASQNSEIQAWVNGGGGLIVTQPNITGANLTVFPPSFEVVIYNPSWPGGFVAAIVNPTHPITQGLVDNDLSGNFDWVRSEDIGTNWDILAVDLETPSDVALLAGEYGSGRLVFNTGNFGGASADPGSDMYISQMIDWAGGGEYVDCQVTISPSSVNVYTWDTVQFSTTLNGSGCYVPCYTWSVSSAGTTGNTGSTIDANGLYTAGGDAGIDIVTVTDSCNGNISDTAIVNVVNLSGNDECVNSITVEDGVPFTGSSVNATGSDITSCASNDALDVWHNYTPAVSGCVTFSTSGSGFDTTLAVFDACGGTELACDDDGGSGLDSRITIDLTSGHTYQIRVAGYGGTSGEYVLTASSGGVCGPCQISISPPSVSVYTWDTVQFSSTVNGSGCYAPCYTWEVSEQESTGSTINGNGLYTAGGNAGTDIVRVTDTCNGNISDTATVIVDNSCVVDCTEDESGALNIVETNGTSGNPVTVTVEINSAPNIVDALGFEVIYNPDCLEYTGYTWGDCVENWSFVDVTNPEPGVLRIGAFTTVDPILQGESCDVIEVTFNILTPDLDDKSKAVRADLQALVDDVAGWPTSPGYICGGCKCDINGDEAVTPQDALCAFKKYLGICPTACGPCEDICGDVNGDGTTTPADALCIFQEYLGMGCEYCSAPTTTTTTVPSECEPKSCGTYTLNCNPQNPGACACPELFEGGGMCIGESSCGISCPNGSVDCPSGEACFVNTCCDGPVCLQTQCPALLQPGQEEGKGTWSGE